MRLLFAPALLLLLPACASQTQEVLPLSRAIVGASQIARIEIILQPTAQPAVAALDGRAETSGAQGPAAQSFKPMLEAAVREAALRSGLNSGRTLRLVLDIDAIEVQGTGAALFGRADRLAGTVYVRDAQNGAALGQLYVDVGGGSAGPIALAIRGGGVRERLARAFADRVAGALSGRKPPSY
ncbi:MAG TPA: hypothetical protein VF631_06970 [Allosphingosinicella sp.]